MHHAFDDACDATMERLSVKGRQDLEHQFPCALKSLANRQRFRSGFREMQDRDRQSKSKEFYSIWNRIRSRKLRDELNEVFEQISRCKMPRRQIRCESAPAQQRHHPATQRGSRVSSNRGWRSKRAQNQVPHGHDTARYQRSQRAR